MIYNAEKRDPDIRTYSHSEGAGLPGCSAPWRYILVAAQRTSGTLYEKLLPRRHRKIGRRGGISRKLLKHLDLPYDFNGLGRRWKKDVAARICVV